MVAAAQEDPDFKHVVVIMIGAFIGEVHADVDAGRRILLRAYREAVAEGYRFYSFGDAMLIV